jgi:DNA polymerase III epsilon subunit-like protein
VIDAPSLEEIREEICTFLDPNDSILVGCNIKSDIDWLKLEKGVHYLDEINLCETYKAYNARYRNYTYFSLDDMSKCILGEDQAAVGTAHSAERDAILSMKIFRRSQEPGSVESDKRRLLKAGPTISWAKRNNYKYNGVCMAAFSARFCTCGDVSLRQ